MRRGVARKTAWLEPILSAAWDAPVMSNELILPEELIDEIVRYLAVVDAFRAAGCEPIWRPEPERSLSSANDVLWRLEASTP